MSELVRKAEADIDALRGRLSLMGGAARGEAAVPSSSAALLQARLVASSQHFRLTRSCAST